MSHIVPALALAQFHNILTHYLEITYPCHKCGYLEWFLQV